MAKASEAKSTLREEITVAIGDPSKITLGEKEFAVRPLKMKASLRWRRRLSDTIWGIVERGEKATEAAKEARAIGASKKKDAPEFKPLHETTVEAMETKIEAVRDYLNCELAPLEEASVHQLEAAWGTILGLENMDDPFALIGVIGKALVKAADLGEASTTPTISS